MNVLDNFLNRITMYRLMLYYLILLLSAALVLSFFNFLPFSSVSLFLSALFIVGVCWISNKIFALIFKAATNVESVYISALILSLVITPAKSLQDLPFLFWVSFLAMASKYILAISKKHIFNPVAIALVITGFIVGGAASWWVGTGIMFPFILLGLLIIKKIQRWNLVFCFLLTALIIISGLSFISGNDIFATFNILFFRSPIMFFALVMLTEPSTTPPTKLLQSIYGAIVGLAFYVSPEIALVFGNIFSYIVSPKAKLILSLKRKIKIAPDVYEFVFAPNQNFSFLSGQYMEWTLPHGGADSRGNRRYFTLASSPTENNLRLGIKFYPQGSTFKKAMLSMNNKTQIVASQLAGEFTLPKDPKQKLVFIAGGIGITPFRSMIKYLLDKNQRRSIVFFCANKNNSEIVYKDIFDQAERKLGIKTIYCLTDENTVPANWQGKVGRINERMIQEEVPDYTERTFYLSGPRMMVTSFENTLRSMGIPSKSIKTDFFPGYA